MTIEAIRERQTKDKIKLTDKDCKRLDDVFKAWTDDQVSALLGRFSGPIRRQLKQRWDDILDDRQVYRLLLYSEKVLGRPLAGPRLMRFLVYRLAEKLEVDPSEFRRVKVLKLKLVVQKTSDFVTSYEGDDFEGTVSGLTVLEGTFMVGGARVKVFPKFVSHPFYQYGSRTIKPKE